MSGLRVCMVTTFYPPHNFGGDGIAVQRLSRALVRAGHEVTVLTSSDAFVALGGEAPPPDDGGNADGVLVHRLRTALPALSLLLTQQTGRPLATRRRIREVLSRGRFDVINYHNVSLVGGPAVLAEGEGIKVYTAHEHWLVCPTHVLWRHQREPCPARQCLRCTLVYRRPPQLWRYTGYLERQLVHVDTFMAMSEFSRAKHREFGFPREMSVVPPLLDDAAPGAGDSAAPHPRPYFLFVGRLERLKGLDDVLPMIRDYQDADFVVVGDGEHRASLERLAAGREHIRFVGRIPGSEVGRYYAHAIATVVPSAGYETFGFVAIEALQQSTPVLARRRGGLTEIVEGSGGGELFDTPEELRAAMQRMHRDPVRRAALGRAGRAAYAERWSERVVLPKYLGVIEEAARRRGARHVLETLAAGRAA